MAVTLNVAVCPTSMAVATGCTVICGPEEGMGRSCADPPPPPQAISRLKTSDSENVTLPFTAYGSRMRNLFGFMQPNDCDGFHTATGTDRHFACRTDALQGVMSATASWSSSGVNAVKPKRVAARFWFLSSK